MKINKIIDLLKEDTENTLKSLDEKSLLKIIKYLSDYYYNENVSLISDQLFDFIKDFYENEYNVKYLEVGAPIKSNGKVKLPYYMGSLDKIKPSTGTFDKWINEYTGPYICSYKLDGVSALLYKKNNKVLMFTRGNGIEGQDISHCIKFIGINISNLIEGDAIRGELIISKENFKKISDKMANARNAVSGIINTKKPDPAMLKLIDFVAYWVLSPQIKCSEQLNYIEKKNFIPRTVYYKVYKKLTIDDLSKELINARNNYKYEIDGIVVIDDSKIYPQEIGENPSYGFAFKQVLTDQIAESIVVDVIWDISKDKYIKPKIKIVPIELLGSEITYATAFNAKYIVDNIIGPGTIVKIIKSGDVIPYIQEIIKISDSGKPKMPTIKYKWNDTNVDIIAEDLDEEHLNKIIVKKITYFFTTLDIKFMAEGTIQKFVDNGFDDLWKILDADKNKLEKVDGMGKTIIDKLYQSINDGLIGRKLFEIMAASQIFGRGIGSRKFKLITDNYPNILDIYKNNGTEYTKKLINSIMGFEEKTTSKIIDNLDNFITFLNKFLKIKPNLLITNNIENESNIPGLNLKDYEKKIIVFTGFRDKEIESELDKINSKVNNSISKNTDLLIAADINEQSSKINKAKELQIKIISKEQFYKSIGK